MSSSSQSKPFFVDTNVWLYAFIASQDPNKAAKARNIIRQSGLIISAQVINEICVNLLKKARFDEPSIQLLINSFYNKYSVGAIDKDLLLKSSELREKWQFSFWDSLIVSSALAGGADILYTEDMTDGLVVENRLKITNPFGPR
jgi:predicted nucleic acid-binding protein